MLSHISLGVKDLDQSGAFYDALFAPMGITRTSAVREDELAYAPPGTAPELAPFWLYRVDNDESLVGARTHIAFSVSTRKVLDALGRSAESLNAQIFRKAGAHPDIAASYYGMIIADPTGHKIEFVVSGD